jgi:hypothetical protein
MSNNKVKVTWNVKYDLEFGFLYLKLGHVPILMEIGRGLVKKVLSRVVKSGMG